MRNAVRLHRADDVVRLLEQALAHSTSTALATR